VIHRRGPSRSFEAVEFATRTWVDWFTNRRLLEPIGNIPPAEARSYYAMLQESAGRVTQTKWPPAKPGAVHMAASGGARSTSESASTIWGMLLVIRFCTSAQKSVV
jgi:hypothetical protein